MKSFYASIECVERGLHPLHTYSHQLNGILTVPGKTYIGKVKNLTFQSVSFETKEGYISIPIKDILSIDLEVEYESA
ncbi:hypothetical protein [Streptococcus suis]|uniref:hypothetical protein n=1 Tax=Streptococcus suis TaxID=1307 RepID=UPI003F4DF91C